MYIARLQSYIFQFNYQNENFDVSFGLAGNMQPGLF